ncbi:MAG: NADP-dependent phosphogluconate dehydrogenase [Nitrososphaerota archaeon]
MLRLVGEEEKMPRSDIGVYGLGVMGESIALNLARNGYKVSVFNRTPERTRKFISERGAARGIEGYYDLSEFIQSINKPRKVIIFVKAGAPVDEVISLLKSLLDKGDVIIDCGNSHFKDSDRRYIDLTMRGIHFLGVGVSGGEEGALKGPSIMVGGSIDGYLLVGEILEKISAKFDGTPCVAYFGTGGAGHFVKTVHNGIEYSIMQAIAEAYHFLSTVYGLRSEIIGDLFAEFNKGELSSFLIAAAANVLKFRDEETGSPLVDLILDEAEQKGTGLWTSQAAIELGVPAPSIEEAVTSRLISTRRRLYSSLGILKDSPYAAMSEAQMDIEIVRDTLKLCFIASYIQGLDILHEGSTALKYGLNVADAAKVWRAGCIIRSRIIQEIYTILKDKESFVNPISKILNYYSDDINSRLPSMIKYLQLAFNYKVPVPVTASIINYLYSVTSRRLPANLIQALRDYFGAHMFKRIDKEGIFHSTWGRIISD